MNMREWFQKYTGILRSLRISYWVFNLFNLGKLKSNEAYYRKHGIKKPVWQSISHADIKSHEAEVPWMDIPDINAELISNKRGFSAFPSVVQEQILKWPERGYMIIPGLMAEYVDAINSEIGHLLAEKKVDFNFTGRKIMDAWKASPVLDRIFRHKKIISILEFIFDKEVAPFQTINFLKGSEQKPHSDSIHMTTEPLGYLAAIWIALEDISEGSGELVYFPGSHRYPYIMSEDYDSGNTALKLGEQNYPNYEARIAAELDAKKPERKTFLAKKGDVLFWHANLLHGGAPIISTELTRKSMVAHYFARGVLCYHELSQRPAVLR